MRATPSSPVPSSTIVAGSGTGAVAPPILTCRKSWLANGTQDSHPCFPISIENFGKLNDNYYRGSQPTVGQFDELKKIGIKTIIDLRKDSIEAASQQARDAGLQYVNIPLPTKRPATGDQTAQFLKLVNDPVNWPVFVHCKGGRHRTGEMTAIYRISHDGWSGEQAYEEMKKYDFEDNFFYPRSRKKYVFRITSSPDR